MTDKCSHTGCEKDAVGVLGIAWYPPKSVMDHYKTDAELTRMVTSLKVCQEHFDEIDIYDAILNQPSPKGNSTFLESMATFFEGTSKTAVDRKGCKKLLLPLDDPDYQVIVKLLLPFDDPDYQVIVKKNIGVLP